MFNLYHAKLNKTFYTYSILTFNLTTFMNVYFPQDLKTIYDFYIDKKKK